MRKIDGKSQPDLTEICNKEEKEEEKVKHRGMSFHVDILKCRFVCNAR